MPKRKNGVSNINEHSSRSHTIFSLVMESQEEEAECETEIEGHVEETQTDKGNAPPIPVSNPSITSNSSGRKQKSSNVVVRVSTMNLVDLAGSESFSTKFGHSQQQETKAINKSLSALNPLSSRFRRTKNLFRIEIALTRMLKSSLGGNAETDIIITLHNEEEHLKQSKYTIEFGSLANKIVCKVHENVASNDDKVLIRKYKSELQKLAAKLKAAESWPKKRKG